MVLKGWSNFMLIIFLITGWNIFNRFVEVVMKTHFLSSLVTMFLMMMTIISDSIISYFRSRIAPPVPFFHAYFGPSMKLKDLNLHKTSHFWGNCIAIGNRKFKIGKLKYTLSRPKKVADLKI